MAPRDTGADPAHNFWIETFIRDPFIGDGPDAARVGSKTAVLHVVRVRNLKVEGHRIVEVRARLIEPLTKLKFRGDYAKSDVEWEAHATFFGNRGRPEWAELQETEICRNARPLARPVEERVQIDVWYHKGYVPPDDRPPNQTYQITLIAE